MRPRKPGRDLDTRPSAPAGSRLPWTFAAPFALVGLYGLYLKHLLLEKPSGLLALKRFLGQPDTYDFSLFETLALYAEDLFVGVALLPVGAVLVLSLVSQRRRLPVATLMSSILVLVFYAAMLSVGNTGVLLDRQLALDAVRWAWDHPASIADYASASSLAKLGLVALAVHSLSWLASTMDRHGDSGRVRLRRRFARTYGILSGAITFVWLVTFSVPVQALAPSTSATRSLIERLFEPDPAAGAYAQMPAEQLADEFAAMTGTPAVKADAWFGAAAGHDVVLFVLETATTRNFDISAELEAEGALAALADSSIVSPLHHSTYPYTSDAIFSILASLYPAGRKDALAGAGGEASTGWVDALARSGYATVQYSPYADSFEDDSTAYRAFGFQRRYMASTERSTPDPVMADVAKHLRRYEHVSDRSGELAVRLRNDLMAWHRMRADIADWNRRGQPFVAMYAPMIGHGPWFDLPGSADFDERGRYVARLQMSWLSDLVRQLRDSGTLERTIIIVTGDHGPRTRSEYPALTHGAITGTSIRVPLLMYSKAAVAQPTTLVDPTSHIDIGPTIMHWLGIEDWQAIHAGIPVRQATGARRIFFFGRDYFGADGFLDASGYHSCEYMMRSCLTDEHMRFDTGAAAVSDAATASHHVELLTSMSQHQRRAVALALREPTPAR